MWEPPPPEALGGTRLETEIMTLGASALVSFEVRCCDIEAKICSADPDVICRCCEGKLGGEICDSCQHAVGFHRCCSRECDWGDALKWKQGTLYMGRLDAQRALFNLHRKLVPTDSLHATAQRYVDGKHMTSDEAARIMRAIEQQRGQLRITGDASSSSGDPGGVEGSSVVSPKMSLQEMAAELRKREEMMRSGGDGAAGTDQWRAVEKPSVGKQEAQTREVQRAAPSRVSPSPRMMFRVRDLH